MTDSYLGTFAAAPDGKTAAFLSSGPRGRFVVKLIDWEKKVLKASLSVPAQIFSLAFSPDGKFLVLGGYHCASYLWDLSKIPVGP